MTGGEGSSVGGGVTVTGGVGTADTGGQIELVSGAGTATSSGAIVIRSANGGTKGVSGLLSFSSGTTSSGTSGSVSIGSGAATGGKGGALIVSVGAGNSGAGGGLSLTAGQTTASAVGGALAMTAGEGGGEMARFEPYAIFNHTGVPLRFGRARVGAPEGLVVPEGSEAFNLWPEDCERARLCGRSRVPSSLYGSTPLCPGEVQEPSVEQERPGTLETLARLEVSCSCCVLLLLIR